MTRSSGDDGISSGASVCARAASRRWDTSESVTQRATP
jgi:hypothetical protein